MRELHCSAKVDSLELDLIHLKPGMSFIGGHPGRRQRGSMQIPDRDAPPFSPQLLLKKMGNNQDIFRAVVKAMQADLDIRLARLANAGAQRDFATAKAESHALKGALGEVTATSAAYLASILERAADARDWETFDLAFSEFQIDANQLKQAIAEHLSAVDGNAGSREPENYPAAPRQSDKLH